MKIESRAVLWDDVLELARTMRPEDKAEVYIANHETPFQAVDNSVNNSAISFTLTVDDKVAAIYGIVPQLVMGRVAWVWMLSSPEIEKIPIQFIKRSRAFFAEALKVYPVLENWTDARYHKSIKWLKMCGAEFDEMRLIGPDQMPMIHFTIRRK